MGSLAGGPWPTALGTGAGDGGIKLALTSASPSSFSKPKRRSLPRGLLELEGASGFEVRLTFSGFSNWRVELLFDDRLVNVGWIMGLG